MKKVYVAMSADIIHVGHVNLLTKAALLGELHVGVLTDEAIAEYKRYPLMPLEQRMSIIGSLKGVSHVLVQNSLSYEENLRLLRPDYVVHGDEWRTGIQSAMREKVIALLGEWGGALVEYPYTTGVSIEQLKLDIDGQGILPERRRSRLTSLLRIKKMVRVLEAHKRAFCPCGRERQGGERRQDRALRCDVGLFAL